MTANVSINRNPALRLMTPYLTVQIGEDVFAWGDGLLVEANLSLGEGEKSSRCSFKIRDPFQFYAEKYMADEYTSNPLTVDVPQVEGDAESTTPAIDAAIASTTVKVKEPPLAPSGTAAKGGEIVVAFGYSPDQLIEYRFIHNGTKHEGVSPWYTSFDGQSVRWLLTRRTKNTTYQSVTLRELAEKVATGYGLTVEMPDGDGPTFTHLDQTGITDYQLLWRECERIGWRLRDVGATLILEPRSVKDQGFILEYGVNLTDFSVEDKAQEDGGSGSTASAPAEASTAAEIKGKIDPRSGQLVSVRPENEGAAGAADMTAVATTGAATPRIEPETTGTTAAADAVSRDNAQRVKGLPASCSFVATPASLELEPGMAIVTVGFKSEFLNRAWVIETVEQSYSGGALKTSLKFYSPLRPRPGQAIAGTVGNTTGGVCNQRVVDAVNQMGAFSSASGPGGGNVACVWAVNRVLDTAGIANPWGNSDAVVSAQSALSGGAGTRVDPANAQPGDIVIWLGVGGHIGIVTGAGNPPAVVSNSSSRRSFAWNSNNAEMENYYGAQAEIYRLNTC